ncbi:MAG: hypothetical protein JSR46_03890 [Verrucomicrobia bacterium]|nr:hypothetical protein [Verrucomicrobiota bacterium]
MDMQLSNIYSDLTLRPASTAEEEAKNFVKFLFSSQPYSSRLVSRRARKALLYKRDPELLLAIQNELQELSKRAVQSTEDVALANLVIGRILALYPFLEPTTALEVPVRINEKWEIVTYALERLELSWLSLGSPLTAFGLTAPSFPSLLLLMGTPPPTISGTLLSVWTDFVPGGAVGELAFSLFAKKRIKAWLDKQSAPVMLYGQSLGAALALHTVCAFDEKIDSVHAYCSPALHRRSLSRFTGHAKVKIYWHKGDIVPLVGRGFHPLWKMVFIASAERQTPFFAHIRVVPALSPFSIEEKMPSRALWPLWTFAHFLLSIPIFCTTTIILLVRAFVKSWR